MGLLCLLVLCLLACLSAQEPSAATTCGEINYDKEKYEILSSILRNHTLETMCYIMKLDMSRVNKLDKMYKGTESFLPLMSLLPISICTFS